LWIHRAILLALPWLIFILNSNWVYQGFGNYDPFYYFGHFIHFPHYQRLQPTYAGERLAWVLPGYVLVHLLTPVYGTLALHFLAYSTTALSLHAILRRFVSPRAALLSVCMLGCHPYFLSANGTDYVTGGCLAYSSLAFLFLVRAGDGTSLFPWALAAGSSWAAAIYTYPVWIALTPACVFVALARGTTRRVVRMALPFAMGMLVLTAGLAAAHELIYGAGGLSFQRVTLGTMRMMSPLQQNPFASHGFSLTFADWLVFPGIAAAIAILLMLPGARRWISLPAGADKLLLANLYMIVVMALMTVRGGLLQFDFMANFLLPGTFLALGVTVFTLPDRMGSAWFWSVLGLSCLISILPLARPGLYQKPPTLGAVLPAFFLVTGAAIRLVRPRSAIAWTACVVLFGAASFTVRPEEGGIAWRGNTDWMAATRRVSAAVETIEQRLPRDRYPAFWYREAAPFGLEFQAIMCAFISHTNSMKNFPEVDAARRYPPGQLLLLLSDRRGAFEAAGSAMKRAGMPIVRLWDQTITSGGVSYWITATEVRSAE
jgi:hypothetical protein